MRTGQSPIGAWATCAAGDRPAARPARTTTKIRRPAPRRERSRQPRRAAAAEHRRGAEPPSRGNGAPELPKHRPLKVLHCVSFRQDFEKPTFVVDISDEFDPGYEPVRVVEPHVYDVDGRLSIHDLIDVLDIDRGEIEATDGVGAAQ